ncbi:FAD-dependent monooxygenase [Roseateles sp. SL47]|uniref:NAD(P)/FAD-dependent oxidoreductase n=1 Tax=Roseateles sp. SL47 TaxID=2995138 RepID=UPI00226DA934|nr:FAD-dependent monooxygenase [Roseateles sp. SL47]WAC71686.1 FAD-dependent monooxygenase [Roseateles sp. SL47]
MPIVPIVPMGAGETQHWDVIVVGSGPAGAALARRLSPGHRVLMLERAPPPAVSSRGAAWRIGESLPGAAAVLLRRQGLWDRFVADGHAERGASISVWDSDSPVWTDALRDPNGPGWHLDRLRFDRMLRNAATEVGASVTALSGALQVSWEGGRWWVRDVARGRRHTAPVLVDATGRNAAVCRRLGLNRADGDRLVCIHALLPPLEDEDRSTRLCADADGWWYSVRVPSGSRVLAFHTDADASVMRALRDPQALLAKSRSHPLLREVVPERMAGIQTRVQPAGSVALDVNGCAGLPGLYVIGDAVLAFDPIASQGLFHALASAESAALAISRELSGEAGARRDFFLEMAQVQWLYRARLSEVYARPVRFRGHAFWDRHRMNLNRSQWRQPARDGDIAEFHTPARREIATGLQ